MGLDLSLLLSGLDVIACWYVRLINFPLFSVINFGYSKKAWDFLSLLFFFLFSLGETVASIYSTSWEIYLLSQSG